MYITTHKITNPEKHIHGINSFLYLVSYDDLEPAQIWTEGYFEEFIQKELERPDFEDCELTPGGNTVLSYLDVIALTPCTLADLVQSLDAFERKHNLESASFPLIDTDDNLIIRFSMVHKLEGRIIAEYFELSSAVQRIFRKFKMEKQKAG